MATNNEPSHPDALDSETPPGVSLDHGQEHGSLDPADAGLTTNSVAHDPSLGTDTLLGGLNPLLGISEANNSELSEPLAPSLGENDLSTSAATEPYGPTNPFIHVQPGWDDMLGLQSPLFPPPSVGIHPNPLLQTPPPTPAPMVALMPAPAPAPGGLTHHQVPPKPTLKNPPSVDLHGPSSLFNINKKVFGGDGTILDSPVTTLVGVVSVDVTDPEFHKYYKQPYTVDQALAVINRANPAVIQNFTEGMKDTGRSIVQTVEVFLNQIIRGYQLSTELTVALIPLTLVKALSHPKARTTQDATQAWLSAPDDQVAALLHSLKKGVIPGTSVVDMSRAASSPGLARLASADKQTAVQAFCSYYEALISILSYSSEGNMHYLQSIDMWKRTGDYKQKFGEELTIAIGRERSLWIKLVQDCRMSSADTEIPTERSRILNWSSVPLTTIFDRAEERQLTIPGCERLLLQPWEKVITECLAEERRQKEKTISQIAAAERSGLKAAPRQDRQERVKTLNPRQPPTHEKKRSSPPSQGGAKKCANHPDTTAHSSDECLGATPEGYCLKHIRNFCSIDECRWKHKLNRDYYTPAERQNAASKAPKGKGSGPRDRHRALPTVLPNACDPTGAPAEGETGWAGRYRDADAPKMFAVVSKDDTTPHPPASVRSIGSPAEGPATTTTPPASPRATVPPGAPQKPPLHEFESQQCTPPPKKKKKIRFVGTPLPGTGSFRCQDPSGSLSDALPQATSHQAGVDTNKYLGYLLRQAQELSAELRHMKSITAGKGSTFQGALHTLQDLSLVLTDPGIAAAEAVKEAKKGSTISFINHKGTLIVIARTTPTPIHQVGPNGLGPLPPGAMYTTDGRVIATVTAFNKFTSGITPPTAVPNEQFPYAIIKLPAGASTQGISTLLVSSPSFDVTRWINTPQGPFPFQFDLCLMDAFVDHSEQPPKTMLPPKPPPLFKEVQQPIATNIHPVPLIKATHVDDSWNQIMAQPDEPWFDAIDDLDLGAVSPLAPAPCCLLAASDFPEHCQCGAGAPESAPQSCEFLISATAPMSPVNEEILSSSDIDETFMDECLADGSSPLMFEFDASVPDMNAVDTHKDLHGTAVDSAGRQDGNHKGSNDVASTEAQFPSPPSPVRELNILQQMMGNALSPSRVAAAVKAKKRLREASEEIKQLFLDYQGSAFAVITSPKCRTKRPPVRYSPQTPPSDDQTPSDCSTSSDSSLTDDDMPVLERMRTSSDPEWAGYSQDYDSDESTLYEYSVSDDNRTPEIHPANETSPAHEIRPVPSLVHGQSSYSLVHGSDSYGDRCWSIEVNDAPLALSCGTQPLWICTECGFTNEQKHSSLDFRCECCHAPRPGAIRQIGLNDNAAGAIMIMSNWLSMFPQSRQGATWQWLLPPAMQKATRISNVCDTDRYVANHVLRTMSTVCMSTYALITSEHIRPRDRWTTLPAWSAGQGVPTGLTPGFRILPPSVTPLPCQAEEEINTDQTQGEVIEISSESDEDHPGHDRPRVFSFSVRSRTCDSDSDDEVTIRRHTSPRRHPASPVAQPSRLDPQDPLYALGTPEQLHRSRSNTTQGHTSTPPHSRPRRPMTVSPRPRPPKPNPPPPSPDSWETVFVVRGANNAHKAHQHRDCKWIINREVTRTQRGARALCATCFPVQRKPKKAKQPKAKPQHQTPRAADSSIEVLAARLHDLHVTGMVSVDISITTDSPSQTAGLMQALTEAAADTHTPPTIRINPAARGTGCDTARCVVAATTKKGHTSEHQLHGFIVHLETGNGPPIPAIAVPDTAAEVSVIAASLTQPSWEVMCSKIESVAGVGGDCTLTGKVAVPLRLRYHAPPIKLKFRPSPSALDELRGAHMILGLQDMDVLGFKVCTRERSIEVSLDNQRCHIILEPVSRLVQRLKADGLRVLTLCNGAEFVQYAFRDAGWLIESWVAHEIDPVARQLAAALFPGIEHREPHDILRLPINYIADGPPITMVILTSMCPGFSKAKVNPPPRGFDDPRSDTLVHGSRIIRAGLASGKVTLFFSEQVPIHAALKGAAAEQDELIGAHEHGHGYVLDDAADSASPTSRVRRLAQNITNLKKLAVRRPINPNTLVTSGCTATKSPLPCLVSADQTHHPAEVYDPTMKARRQLNEDEREAVMGYPRGCTNAFGMLPSIMPKKRRQLMGQALNYWQMAAIVREMTVPAPTIITHVAAPTMLGADPDNLEALLASKTLDQTIEWVQDKFSQSGFVLPELRITLRDPDMLPYQSKQRVTVQAGLVASAEDWVEDALNKGIIVKAQYSHDMWIASQFFKAKHGRVNKQGNPEVRPLVNQAILTDACEYPFFWLESMPTVANAASAIPAASTRYCEIDIEGFYNLLNVHKSSWKYQGVWILGELYQYTKCIQGSGPAAAWANYVLELLYNAAFGMAWTNWWAKFVDDHLCHGQSDAQVLNRAKMLRAVLTAGGLKVSDKTPGVSAASGQLAGITATTGGITLNKEATDALVISLETCPKTTTQLRALIGVILYTHTAFKWDIDSLAWFAKTLAPLHKGTTLKPFKWNDECAQSLVDLKAKVLIAPRWFTHFENLITDDTCLVIMSDACDTGGGAALFLVQLSCASMVIPMVHLTDPAVSRLLSTKSKVFSATDMRRPTFETEFKMTVLGMKTWGNLITTLTINYPPGRDKPCKIGVFTDSSVAASKHGGGHEGRPRSFVYELPPEPIDFVSARAKSFLEMRDSVAYSRYWPLLFRFTSGETNCLADLLSRIADQLKALAQDHKEAGVVAAPIRLHSYHDPKSPDPCPGEDQQPEPPLPLKGIVLSRADTEEMIRAYTADHSLYHKVKMSEIYTACTEGMTTIHPSAALRIKPWVNKRFYAQDGILYTQASYLRFRDLTGAHARADSSATINEEDTEERASLAGFMIPVIPPGARIKISDPEVPAGSETDLRQDIMLVIHDFRMHTPLGEMQAQVRLIGWWPQIMAACRYHVMTCAICLQHRRSATAAGLSTLAMERLSVMQFDHCELEPAVAQATGYPSVLTMTDVATAQMTFAPAEDETAMRTAYLLITYWIRIYGVPKILQSDSGSGFCSEVFNLMCRLLGIKAHDTSARAQKGTAAKAERANAYVRRMERIMTANGQVSATHLHMYCASIEIAANQQTLTSGFTSHERLFAQRPVTVADLIAPDEFPVINIEEHGLSDSDAQWIKFFAGRAKDMHLRRIECADERARDTTLTKDSATSNSNATLFDLRVGDQVSYGGEVYKLKSLNGPPGEPITAMINQPDKRDRKVQYAMLKPLATARPTLRIPFMTPCDTGAFVFYDAGDDTVACGKVVDQGVDDIKVHIHEANAQGSRWHALYVDTDGSIQAITARSTPPEGSVPHTDRINTDTVLAVGEVTKAGALSQELQEARRAIGF